MDSAFARVVALVAAEPPVAGERTGIAAPMGRLCRAAARALPASGVGMAVMTEAGVRGLAVTSDPRTERLEEIQFTTGEGPCMDAFTTRRPVLVSDLGDGALRRWPGYALSAHQTGVRAVFAFPLQIGSARLGVLDVFRDATGPLSAAEVSLAHVFAQVAVATLLDGQEQTTRGAADLRDALTPGVELFQAQGMVMVQLGSNLTDAMATIRAYAFAQDRPVAEVAADIVARRLVFGAESP
jgi:hypothetical protein